MQAELERAKTSLAKSDPAPYFLSYEVYDQHTLVIAGTYGTIVNSSASNRRWADVTMRVGSPALDNTHNENRESGITSGALPLADDRDAIARSLWDLTNREYRRAAPAYAKVMSNTAVQAAEEDKSPDFSKETPQTEVDLPSAPITLQSERMGRQDPEIFGGFPKISRGLHLDRDAANSSNRPPTSFRAKAAKSRRPGSDGAPGRWKPKPAPTTEWTWFAWRRSNPPNRTDFPSEKELAAKEEKMAADLKALREAPLAEPFDGPALLSGRAAAVFFHEVLGHRLEGHRQRGETEGQTFTKKVNQSVLPDFLSVYDDPTLARLNGVPLAGTYSHDDEGVPSQRVSADSGRHPEKFSDVPHADYEFCAIQRTRKATSRVSCPPDARAT